MEAESPSVPVPDPTASSLLDVTIATAGHVDHGKSTLVEALTGTNPDRLPEERRRQMTIELGFASMARPGGGRLAFIDVPGHERLVETMVAGIGSVDAALLAVAADDGPMPQTVEHLGILKLLGVERLIVALTRIDLVDDDWLDLAIASTRDLLDDSAFDDVPIVPVSAITGDGLDDLRDRLLAIHPRCRIHDENSAVWLPIDRTFHVHGYGTVVAGTLSRGHLHRGDTVVLSPGGLRSTVRQLQSHHREIESGHAGQRVSVNLSGIGLDQVSRGSVLSNRSIPAVTTVDIRFESVGPVPKSGQPVRVMVGTDRVDATIQLVSEPGAVPVLSGLARLRFRRPVATLVGDRLIVRRPSPPATIGGGVVLARYAGRPPRLDGERRSELAALADGDPGPTLRRRLAARPISITSATADLPESATDQLHRWLQDGMVRLVSAPPFVAKGHPSSSSIVISEVPWLTFIQGIEGDLASCHVEAPETLGLPLTELRRRSCFSAADFDDLLGLAVREGLVNRRDGIVGLPGHAPRLRASERPVADGLLRRLADQRSIQVMDVSDVLSTTIDLLERIGEITRIDDDRIMSTDQFEHIAQWVIATSRSEPLDLPTIRDRIGLGRKSTQLLLERLDQMGLTVRHGNERRPGSAAEEWLSARADRQARRTEWRSGDGDRGIIAP